MANNYQEIRLVIHDAQGREIVGTPMPQEQYEAFRIRFHEHMKPILDQHAINRAESELASMHHWVD